MSIVRARVVMRDLPANASSFEREMAAKKLRIAFKRVVDDAGILHDYKLHENYESPGEKKRRKKKESRQFRLKNKLRENFAEKRQR